MERKFRFKFKEKVKQLPNGPGVYCLKDKEILYIGKASNLRERVKNHFQSAFAKASARQATRDNLFIDKVTRVGYFKTDSEIGALVLEANLIKKYQPKYNVIWKDDKNYFFVGITKESFPQIFWTHQTKLKTKNYKLKTKNYKLKTNYVGPFVDGKALKQTLKILRKVFPYRSCRVLPKRSCLWYHLERCPAPCLIKTQFEEKILFDRIKRECQKNAENVFKIFQGKKTQVLKNLKKEMKEAAKIQNFERAAKIRDQILAFEKVLEHTKIFNEIESYVIKKPWQNYYVWRKNSEKLKKVLGIEKIISRVEAYDVSNIQGQMATGSMVTFINGKPDKNFYRRFKIKIEGKPNDIAMLKETLNRRLNHPEWGMPDLILIDGGRAQLNIACQCLIPGVKQKIKVMALAKKENKLFIENQKEPILLKDLPREIFNLILQLRDEAHRFAISYHKKLREKDLFAQ